MKKQFDSSLCVRRMNGNVEVWELNPNVTQILSVAAGLNGNQADRATARACRAGLVRIYGSSENAIKALGHKPEVETLRLQDGGTVKQMILDAADGYPGDTSRIGPWVRKS